MENGLLEKTGKSLEYWSKIVRDAKLDKYKAIMAFLKSEHNFTHGFANFVALKTLKTDAGSFEDDVLITNQYKGKELLKPIYDKLIELISQFGQDITFTPKKDSVSIIRKRQFTLIKPATKTRIDLGLKLPGKLTTLRLENSGPFGAMCTHRVRIETLDEIDDQLISWIKEAYEMAQ